MGTYTRCVTTPGAKVRTPVWVVKSGFVAQLSLSATAAKAVELARRKLTLTFVVLSPVRWT